MTPNQAINLASTTDRLLFEHFEDYVLLAFPVGESEPLLLTNTSHDAAKMALRFTLEKMEEEEAREGGDGL